MDFYDKLKENVFAAGERYGHGKADCDHMGIGTLEVGWWLREQVYFRLVEILERDYLPVLALEKWEQICRGVGDELENVGRDRFSDEHEQRMPEALERVPRMWCQQMALRAMAAMFGDTWVVDEYGFPKTQATCVWLRSIEREDARKRDSAATV
jgi:hypothetical protein